MRKQLLNLMLLGTMLILSVSTYAQLFTEDFSGNAMPPAGWTIEGGGDANWKVYAYSNNAGGTAPEAAFSWGPPVFTGVSRLVSPEIATSGNTSLILEFYSFVWDFAGSGYTYKVETTSDGGATWNTVWSISPTGDIPSELQALVIENGDVGSDNFQFALTFDGSTTQINYWYFDSFVLSTGPEEAYSVSYTVTDEDDNPVEGALVNLQSGGTMTTDAAGEVVFANVLPGDYTWWANASGMATETGTVAVTDADVSVDVELSISSELFSDFFVGGGGVWPPAGWSLDGDGSQNWNRPNSEFAGGAYPEIHFNSTPTFDGTSRFVSPEIVTLGYTNLFLSFKQSVQDNGGNYSLKVETTSDGGTTWNEAWSISPTGDMGPMDQTVLISTDDVGSELFQFAFTFEGNSALIQHWYIDNAVLVVAKQYDAAILALDMPSLTAPDTDINPSVEVGNLGFEVITFDVTLEYTDGTTEYSETITITDLDPLATEIVNFPTWTSIAGSYDGEVYVTLADDEVLDNNSINFGLEVASGLVPKRPLYEIFTSSTCPPCVPANEVLDAVLEENPDEYSLIKYQVNWPAFGDPYYTEECGDRVDYYGIVAAPTLNINSETFPSIVSFNQASFDASLEAESALQIDITDAAIEADNMITISADLVSAANYSAGLSAHIVVIEKLTTGNVGSNGETEFLNVMMKMLPDASGETLDEIQTGVPITLTQSYDMGLTNMETPNDLAVVVFVQNDIDKSVIQSAMVDVDFVTGIESNSSSQEKIKLYPNPASDNLMVKAEIDIQKIEMYNQLGQLVKSKNTKGLTQNLNIADLESGLYIVRVFSQGSVITESVVVE